MFHISINCLSIILWWFWTAKQTNPFIFSKLSQISFVRNKNSSFEIKKCPYSKLIFGSGCGGRFPRLNKSWDIFLLKINYSTIRNKKKNWLRKYRLTVTKVILFTVSTATRSSLWYKTWNEKNVWVYNFIERKYILLIKIFKHVIIYSSPLFTTME